MPRLFAAAPGLARARERDPHRVTVTDFIPVLRIADALRRTQGDALALLGFGPSECEYRILASGGRWRLRAYGGGGGPPLLIVAAPIKRPYIWDLAPPVSAVRLCLRHAFRVYLLEWNSPAPDDDDAGLAGYARKSIGAAVTRVSRDAGGARPFLLAHSLGGTLAAIYSGLHSRKLRGLVLLATPLCFQPGSSRFRDALVAMAPPLVPARGIVPGSLLSHLSAVASPETFVWSRLVDAATSITDLEASEMLARVERWTLDELPLPARLVHEILVWLYRENRFCAGALRIGSQALGPSSLRVPTLAVVNSADGVAPSQSIAPFIAGMQPGQATVLEHPGEIGVSLQHLAILIGRRAQVLVWPEIISWLHAHA
jgi:polyhydroxyalkanoate synthase